MILQALTRYYEDLLSRGEIAAPGWSPAKISYALCLNGAGDLEQVIPTMEEVTKGKKTALQPQTFSLPAAVKRTVGIDANFLWDNSSYLLGVDQKGQAGTEPGLLCCSGAEAPCGAGRCGFPDSPGNFGIL